MYLLFALAYILIDWHIPPLSPDSIINNISTSVDNSKFTFVFVKHACQANPGADKKNKKDQAHMFQCIYL